MKASATLIFLFLLKLMVYGQSLTANPNPCAKRTLVSYTLLTNDTISLTVVDVSGKTVITTYTDFPKSAGNYQDSLIFDNLNMGVYFVSLKLRQGKTQNIKVIKTDPVGLADNSTAAPIRVFPNPFVESIRVEVPSESHVHIQLFNSIGETVYSNNHTAFSPKIDISYLESGVYFLEILCRDEREVFRLIKE